MRERTRDERPQVRPAVRPDRRPAVAGAIGNAAELPTDAAREVIGRSGLPPAAPAPERPPRNPGLGERVTEFMDEDDPLRFRRFTQH